MAYKAAIGKLWGPSPSASHWTYMTMIKPLVLYGAIVWAHRIPNNFKPLIRLQRLALLCLGHFPRSTPTHGLEVILNYTPLDLLAREKAALTAHRTYGCNPARWDGLGTGQKRGHLYLARTDWTDTNSDSIPPCYYWNQQDIVDMDSLTHGQPKQHKGTVCYTDGSKTDDKWSKGTGFGYVIIPPNIHDTKSYWGNLGHVASVYQGEVFAIHQAAEHIIALNLPPPYTCLLYTSDAADE